MSTLSTLGRLLPLSLVLGTAAAGVSTYAAADESTTVSGRIYADLSNIDLTKDGVKQAASGTGVDVKRLYIGVTHNFDDMWSVNGTTDFNYTSATSETQVYIKKAYVQAKISDAFVARLGSADMPWIPFVEDLYGYRYLEQTLIDRLKYGTSADWGVNANGKGGNGMFNYSVSLVNGGGYKNPTRTKSMDMEGRIGFVPMTGLTLAAGFYTGKLGKDVQATTSTTFHTANRFDLLAAYVNAGLRLGAEYFQAKDWVVTQVAADKADGYSLWASYNFDPMWAVFARADQAKTSKDINSKLKDEYFNLGVTYKPRKNVELSVAYKNDKVDNGSISTGNGTIGGVTAGKFNEIGVWALVQF
jgi:hypothetical protein